MQVEYNLYSVTVYAIKYISNLRDFWVCCQTFNSPSPIFTQSNIHQNDNYEENPPKLYMIKFHSNKNSKEGIAKNKIIFDTPFNFHFQSFFLTTEWKKNYMWVSKCSWMWVQCRSSLLFQLIWMIQPSSRGWFNWC